ncbi:MAG: nitroreductase family deazaflavin-dependent oxidoreductase [Deltaproteobacteria bacterium]|nr:nitroreductase family deazaflavin-dependent oxidoreductase [Deltaproteobacteria bacterium]
MSTTDTFSSPAVSHQVPFSIRVLRGMRPLIAALLASPLHGLLSRDVLLMTWIGRKSSRRYTLPLSYVEQGSKLYLCTRPEGSRWWRNLEGGAEVELTLRGRRVSAAATILDADSPEALEGLRAFVSRNPRTGEMLYHVAREGGAPRESDVRREVASSIVVRLVRT